MPCRHRVRRRFQTSFRRMDHCIFWRLGFRQSSCSPYRAGPSVRRPIRLDPTTDFLPCCCPQYFLSDQGQALGPRTSLQVPPHCVGDTTGRFVAHHALVPFTFRIQVSHQAHEPPSEFVPAAPGIQRGASWRTMVVEEREQIRLAAVDPRAMQRVPGPDLIRPGGLEPAEHRRFEATRPMRSGPGSVVPTMAAGKRICSHSSTTIVRWLYPRRSRDELGGRFVAGWLTWIRKVKGTRAWCGREAPCRIPTQMGRNLEGRSWA